MSNETLYFTALSRLSSFTSGSTDFEKIGHTLIKFMYPTYEFKIPEGGLGTKDGGYDGHDPLKKAKLACSTDKSYKIKIKNEVDKSIKNGDLQLFYFSNQEIPEVEKNKIKADQINTGIELFIFGIDELSREIEKYFQKHHDPYLYDLLYLSFLKVGGYYERNEAKPSKVIYNGNLYKKRITINNRDLHGNSCIYAETKISENPLLDFIISCCSEKHWDSIKNITLCGIGYLGKTFLMKTTYNSLINKFSDKNNYSKYQYLPFVYFCTLKYYISGSIKNIIKNDIDPLFVFLDGLDEINESTRIHLNNELQSILNNNNRVRFIISGRNSSFIDLDIFSNSVQLYLEKYSDPDDLELIRLMENYKDTPIADLLPIPTYRNFVLEKKISKDSKLDEFYNLLVQNNLNMDKERREHSEYITSRMSSRVNINNIIVEISEFCYGLFKIKRMVFTEDELREKITNETDFIFIINSSIIDYHDENNISFVSNFYFEYFVSNALMNKNKRTIIKNFFIRGKIRIPLIDILVLFLYCARTRVKRLHNFIMNKILNDNITYILLCEFDSITDEDRYKYYRSIFKEYNKERRNIYYRQLQQRYGPLKNVDNMARRMQQLLPNRYKTDAVNFLKSEIINYLQYPSINKILSLGNTIILLIPFIDDLWSDKEQIILKEISLPLIRIFLYDEFSKELEKLLSVSFIFDWYKYFKWATEWSQKEWELFYKAISDGSCSLLSEISDDCDFTIKFNIFTNFYDNDYIKSLLLPILRYTIKNKYPDAHGLVYTVPEQITDDDWTPRVRTDARIYTLSLLLEKIELDLSDILDLLIFTIENNLFKKIKDIYGNPINIFEEKLYNNIALLNVNNYKKFSVYYFNINELRFDERLFKGNQAKLLDNLKTFLIEEIINNEIKKWDLGCFLHKLIDFNNAEHSLCYLSKIKEKMPKNIYMDIIYYIFNNNEHILNNLEFIINEYNTLFEKEIARNTAREKNIKNVKEQIEAVKNKDIALMLEPKEMIQELCKINSFLLDSPTTNKNETNFDKLFSLRHEYIIDTITYSSTYYVPPIFSECAIKIMEYFYRNNIFDINTIIKYLYGYLFREEAFYMYFYWYFIDKSHNHDNNIDINKLITTNPTLFQKIHDSMNKDAFDRFSNNSLKYFENDNRQWLLPFFYFYETLLNHIPPKWMRVEHILKLIVVFDINETELVTSTDICLDWMTEKFPFINSYQIVEYGLMIIGDVTNIFSRIQIVKYFIDYYKSNESSTLASEILNFIINTTKKMFDLTLTDHDYAEFQDISNFWVECDSNHIDALFQKFTVEIITSAIIRNKEDIDYLYRKNVLLYCSKLATNEQKTRIIHQIENDLAGKTLSDEENDEIHGFLASLGREKSIKFIINTYLNGKAIQSRYHFNNYPLEYIGQNSSILKDFINLYIYSTEKSNERRNVLLHIAQTGIKQHLTRDNFRIFERRLFKEIKKQKKKSSWKSEYYEEYLLQMEQFVYS
jgi:hypothetical protein